MELPSAAGSWHIGHHRNAAAADAAAPFAGDAVVSLQGVSDGLVELEALPGWATSPLTPLPELAAACGVGALLAKDEGNRFGLRSFKPLGAALGVLAALRAQLAAAHGVDAAGVVAAELLLPGGRWRQAVASVTLAAATDGNWGAALAWAASLFGAGCAIVLPSAASAGRVAAIEAHGGAVHRVDATFDECVRVCAARSADEGWVLVQDTTAPGYEELPRTIWSGYAVVGREIVAQAPEPPTHVFVNCGVGGFAAAVCGHLWGALGRERPRFITAEPTAAACVFASGQAGRAASVPGSLETIQAGLACGEVSGVAWEAVLERGVSDFLTVPDEAVGPCMRLLAAQPTPIVAGESAVAGLAAVVAAARQPALRAKLGLGPESRVVVVVCEGDSDPDSYREILATADRADRGRTQPSSRL